MVFGTVRADDVTANFLSWSDGYVTIVFILKKQKLRCDGMKHHDICTSSFK